MDVTLILVKDVAFKLEGPAEHFPTWGTLAMKFYSSLLRPPVGNKTVQPLQRNSQSSGLELRDCL